ncbi:MAG: CRISPR-associated endonuclease Cas2 [Brooklawnia sp.]|uniref:CRISPR-associated endonuclease Cas2 n=1 Tax=Brooklawnia sp. TaxID=2699740 RepID=UPI003C709F0A
MIDAIVVYDVQTGTPAGARRLRAVAKLCEGIGTRVQYSVFELHCEPAQLVKLMKAIEDTIVEDDSVRVYRVPAGVLAKVIQIGRQRPTPLPGAVIW